MVKTTKKIINKKTENKTTAKKSANIKSKAINTKPQDKTCSCKCFPCFKCSNLSLNIFYITVYTFIVLLLLTIWSKSYNKQIIKEQRCLIHKLYCCGYDNKKECENWQKSCNENKTERLNCDLGK